MKLFTVTLAAAALGMTGFAYAGDAGGHVATMKAPTLLTNSQMANVVAGNLYNPVNSNELFEVYFFEAAPEASYYTVVAGSADQTVAPPLPPDQGMCNGASGLSGGCNGLL